MTADLHTIRTITVNGQYRVRAGEREDGTYEATVVEKYIGGNPLAVMTQALTSGENNEWTDIPDAPTCTHEDVYPAVGLAVQACIDERLERIELSSESTETDGGNAPVNPENDPEINESPIWVFKPEHRHSFGVVFAVGETPEEAKERISAVEFQGAEWSEGKPLEEYIREIRKGSGWKSEVYQR